MTFNNRSNDTIEANPPSNCQCETCKLARFETSKIRYAVVHNYSYNPRTWKLNAAANDPFDYYLGVELETDNYRIDANGSRVRARITNEQAVSTARPARLWLAKHDGSVSGPEFVSHPATLTYWHKQRKALEEMFQMLVHAGFRSHDNDHAGMHVSISKNAFADAKHLYRFLTLLHGNAGWSLKMSQRTHASAEQWASLSYLAREETRRAEVARIMPTPEQERSMSYWNRGSSQRYQALNCPTGGQHAGGRFEFRLPRGTLRIDRFMKNLEWTVAMIEYSRTHTTVAAMKSVNFMRWCMQPDQRAMYPDLCRFLVERFENLIIVGDDIVTPVTVETATAVRPTRTTPSVDQNGQRISPRTGLPMRQYTRREGARRPGRPTGYRPGIARRESYVFAHDHAAIPCGNDNSGVGLVCERDFGHEGEHAACSWRTVENRTYWAR